MINFSCQSGRSEGQLNGETSTPIEGNQAGDAAASARSLPNEEIVQKIEEVLSGVLDTELRCKPGKLGVISCLKNLKIFFNGLTVDLKRQ